MLSTSNYAAALLWYVFFGIIHELSHIGAAYVRGVFTSVDKLIWDKSLIINTLFARQFVITKKSKNQWIDEETSDFIRHSGWIISVSVAFLLHALRRYYNRFNSLAQRNFSHRTHAAWHFNICIVVAYITATEALCTDLFRIYPSRQQDDSDYSLDCEQVLYFFCGNFGIILLHNAWLANGAQSALDILEKMINVTMMRGAQSGGVVTFIQDCEGPRKSSSIKRDAVASSSSSSDVSRISSEQQSAVSNRRVTAVRTRAVKSKRGDLAKILRSRLERDGRLFRHANATDQYPVRFFAGHTRFATSSKATLDGTHPHIWTPATYYRVYDFSSTYRARSNLVNENSWSSTFDRLGQSFANFSDSLAASRRVANRRGAAYPQRVRVENYISHNGDFDFFDLPNGETYDIDVIQKWLVIALETKMPSVVDSAAIAGMVDLIRTQGCFGLSIRFVVCLGLPTSKIVDNASEANLPSTHQYDTLAIEFENVLADMLIESHADLVTFGSDRNLREAFAQKVKSRLDEAAASELLHPFSHYVKEEENGAGIYAFVLATINAFFDNDLFYTVKYFMAHAKGSFGLCVTSSLDAHRQICLAARGQTMSIAFYPHSSLICYGSEQAAVKAGLNVDFPLDRTKFADKTFLDIKNDAMRLDLDDLGGEICLLDWGGRSLRTPALSLPNRTVSRYRVQNNQVDIYLFQETSSVKESRLLHRRMTKLTKNILIKPLKSDSDDLVLQDIKDIPRICKNIQDDWRNKKFPDSRLSLNRLTAWNLSRCLKSRLDLYITNKLVSKANTVDICVTGCEVSLWVAEQFASDLQKSFPKLRTVALSSNKLLGLFGQEISVPAIGFGAAEKTLDLKDAIVIIVSHSGGTFAPLACASLFQSVTSNIFAVVSEWDTQVAKQLRNLNKESDPFKLLLSSRIFSTDVGIRPAEPCSISVVATHQLLTNIFLHMSVVILSDDRYRMVTGAVITERDIEIVERCNQDNIGALKDIVGDFTNSEEATDSKESELRRSGDVWAEHILEVVRAYIMSFVYIIAAVTSGYPIISGIALWSGLNASASILYFLKFLDSLIFFFLPQINVLIVRLIQRRPLMHRMVCRTVVIGDIPWVAQAAEAFLSKLFACSYSIAGLNVMSANPSDHLVHRMTHRIVRGTLLICGRPDGRLSALSSMETSVCLSVSQASSIQSLGSTCESITIGHNPFKLPLSTKGIFLNRHRPLFLCEVMMGDGNVKESTNSASATSTIPHKHFLDRPIVAEEESTHHAKSKTNKPASSTRAKENSTEIVTQKHVNWSAPDEVYSKNIPKTGHSGSALLGMYKTMEKEMLKKFAVENSLDKSHRCTLAGVITSAIHEKKWSDSVRRLFELLDNDRDGKLSIDEFVRGYSSLNPKLSRKQLIKVFHESDKSKTGSLNFNDFFRVISLPELSVLEMIQPDCIRDANGLIQIKASSEPFFGERLTRGLDQDRLRESMSIGATKSQQFSQELYESRIASVQRFVAMVVMFHQIGRRVRDFFANISFGLLFYRMDRTHSIMRIATTASPVSGMDVRDQARSIYLKSRIDNAALLIGKVWRDYRNDKMSQNI